MQTTCCCAIESFISLEALGVRICAAKSGSMWRSLGPSRNLRSTYIQCVRTGFRHQRHLSARGFADRCTSVLAADDTVPKSSEQERRYAVIGAGFAGVAVAWHLLQHATSASPIAIDLFDEVGIAGGASGVAGGLLHAFTNKGTGLWMGQEGYAATVKLLEVAEAAQARALAEGSDLNGALIARRSGILRPAVEQRLADIYKKHAENAPRAETCSSVGGSAAVIDGATARRLVPGLAEPVGDTALFLPRGITINPTRYLENLWRACEQHAGASSRGRHRARLHKQRVDSMAALQQAGYTAVVICSGAAATRFPEVASQLHLSMCRGRVIELRPPGATNRDTSPPTFPSESPSLLGPAWVAAQGPETLLVGATKDWNNGDLDPEVSTSEGGQVAEVLLTKAEAIYPPVRNWEVSRVRSGVRAWAKRTSEGTVPIAGKLDPVDFDPVVTTKGKDFVIEGGVGKTPVVTDGLVSTAEEGSPEGTGREGTPGRSSTWVVGGLGARGLVYHAWLAENAARAIVFENQDLLEKILRRWQHRFVEAAKAERKPRVRKRYKDKEVVSACSDVT